MRIVGVDEAGRGPVLGPLVVAILSIPSEDESMLIEQNISDSSITLLKNGQNSTNGLFNNRTNVIGTSILSYVRQVVSIMQFMAKD